MAFSAFGFKTLDFIGSVAGEAGTNVKIHGYVTNDDAATVETANYFDSVIDRIQSGDQLQCTLDLDGTPEGVMYIMFKSGGHVTIQRFGDDDVSNVAATAIVPTSDGLTTGLIPASARYLAVASAGANDIMTLPAMALVPLGKEIWGKNGATACELRTPASSTHTINGGQADSNEAVVAANVSFVIKKTSPTNWAFLTFTGGAVAAPTPD